MFVIDTLAETLRLRTGIASVLGDQGERMDRYLQLGTTSAYSESIDLHILHLLPLPALSWLRVSL